MIQFSYDFDEYEIQHCDEQLKILKNKESMTKYKMYEYVPSTSKVPIITHFTRLL